MPTLAETLLTSVQQRIRDLRTYLEGLAGRLAASSEATRRALSLFGTYCDVLERRISAEWGQFAGDDATRVSLLRFYLRDIGARLEELEEWFTATESSIPPALVDAVTGECRLVLKSQRHVILAVGDPDNMATLVDELADLVFQSTYTFLAQDGVDLPDDKFALIQISRFEANNPIWRPLILGHEIAHLALLDDDLVQEFHIGDHLDSERISQLSTYPAHYENLSAFPSLAVETAADDWLEELLCDAYAVRRWGPAAVASLGAYFEQVGAGTGYGHHPPGWFRLELMLSWLGDVDDDGLRSVLEPWQELASAQPQVEEDWAGYLVEVFREAAPEIPSLIDQWPDRYDFVAAASRIRDLAQALKDGFPCVEVQEGTEQVYADDPDILNAAWLAQVDGPHSSLYGLVDKALESAEFIRRWQEAGGSVGMADPAPRGEVVAAGAGLLTEVAIRERLVDPDAASRLRITPLLPRAVKETSIDLRLGRHFIVFQRASTGAFDSLIDEDDPRTMQRSVQRRWGEPFVLHPGELVLAATFEYIVLPADLGAQVITRSSYGRLGLITATAVQIHPLFRGCLTLELVNLGALPISLYPGQRIAQLALSVAVPPLQATPDQKYDCPTRPEFSRVRLDWDSEVLRKIRAP